MNDMNKRPPYKPLGAILRHLRERNRESLAEVSGAVEIDEKVLDRIEDGSERPSEDILLLLISHFAVEDDKAAELWQLAGYDKAQAEEESQSERESTGSRQQTLMVMIDPRVMYSDQMEVAANKKGIVLNFSQAAGQHDQPLTIARIGMSREQAKLVLGILHQALYDLDNPRPPRRLGDGSDSSNTAA
ncbi:MAG TPA: helix-turn-helix transcriptional regulator [Candidatus Saccharimonadales bacterium]|nr:helix-turn-helix transcriptional regulator [Candidatus Saccharimonadales bacterium]